jgi:hypothetical protein
VGRGRGQVGLRRRLRGAGVDGACRDQQQPGYKQGGDPPDGLGPRHVEDKHLARDETEQHQPRPPRRAGPPLEAVDDEQHGGDGKPHAQRRLLDGPRGLERRADARVEEPCDERGRIHEKPRRGADSEAGVARVRIRVMLGDLAGFPEALVEFDVHHHAASGRKIR